MKILLHSFDHKILDTVSKNLLENLLSNGFSVRGPIMMPNKLKKWTLLSSPFVHKTARHQLEIKKSSRMFCIDENSKISKPLSQIISDSNFPCSIELIIKS